MVMRDENADTDRVGATPTNRAAHMTPIDTRFRSVEDEKREFPDGFNSTRGASDIGKIVPGK